jgi:acyl-CoA thioesterase-1
MKRLVICSAVVSLITATCARSEREGREAAPEPTVTTGRPSDVESRAAAAQSGPFHAPDTSQAKPRVVFLGDSLTAGYGLDKTQSIPSLIQKRLDAEGYNYEVVNHGVSGDTSAGGVSRLDYALSGDVRVLVVELGGNDGLRGLPVETTKQNLAQIIAGAKRRGVRVLLTGMEAPPNHGPLYTAEFRTAFRDLAREHDVAFMPFFLEGVAGNPALNQSDGIHPTAEGAAIVERTLWKSLEPLLEVRGKADATERLKTDATRTDR